MNTTGFIRGYMARSMKDKDFLKFIISTISKEFEKEVRMDIINDEYLIIMDRYRIKMGKKLISKIKSPYGIDKYILEEFEKQGFTFDGNRSQYIQYCFGNHIGAKIVDVRQE